MDTYDYSNSQIPNQYPIGSIVNGHILTEYGWAPYTPPKTRVAALDWIALVLSIIGFIILPIPMSLGGVIVGHIALDRDRKNAELKNGVAIGALVVGYLGLAYGVYNIATIIYSNGF